MLAFEEPLFELFLILGELEPKKNVRDSNLGKRRLSLLPSTWVEMKRSILPLPKVTIFWEPAASGNGNKQGDLMSL
jgi:hypothetical protein